MNALIIDTETTDTETPEVIELGYMGPLTNLTSAADVACLNFRPTKPISLGALATHHIILDDLKDFPLWAPGAWSLPTNTAYLIGHNVDFDWKAIGSPNVKRICTLALARKAFLSLDSHRLAALIYHLYPHGMARELVKGAHNAAADVGLCWRVLQALIDAYRPRDWAHLWEMSEKARVPTVFTFGKHKGLPIAEVKKIDRGYISWCLSDKCDIVNDDPYWKQALQS